MYMQLLMAETIKSLPVTWKTHVINLMDVSLSKLWETVKDREACQEGNGEGDGTPLQYSCLENPMDGGA